MLFICYFLLFFLLYYYNFDVNFIANSAKFLKLNWHFNQSINRSNNKTSYTPSSFDYRFPSVVWGAPTYLITNNPFSPPSLANFPMKRNLQLFVGVNNVYLFYFCCCCAINLGKLPFRNHWTHTPNTQPTFCYIYLPSF